VAPQRARPVSVTLQPQCCEIGVDSYRIKINCVRGEHKTARFRFFCDRDLAINLMTLKLERDLDILNEVDRSSRSNVIALIEKNTKIALKVKG